MSKEKIVMSKLTRKQEESIARHCNQDVTVLFDEKCGGLNPVSEQIRAAVRGHLCGLIYISLVKP